MSIQPPSDTAVLPAPGPFTTGQKEYLAGFMAGVMQQIYTCTGAVNMVGAFEAAHYEGRELHFCCWKIVG